MIITHLIVIETLLWAGMILGISFLESWVKFRAPLLTKPVGLDVGRTVFSAFHKVQWILLLITILTMLFIHINYIKWLLMISVGLTLILQTLWLHPRLKHRIELIQAGQVPSPSHLHSVYVALELIKLTLLINIGIALMC